MDEIAALVDQYPGLTRTTGALLLILSRARGRTLSNDHLVEQMEAVIGWPGYRQELSTILRTLRKITRPYGLVITTAHGIGLRLEK